MTETQTQKQEEGKTIVSYTKKTDGARELGHPLKEPGKEDLPSVFYELVSSSIAPDGIFPMPAVALQKDGVGVLMSFATSYQGMLCELGKMAGRFVELIVGFDCFTAPEQGTTLPSVVVVIHLCSGKAPRVGVIEYDVEPLPLNWENPFWPVEVAEVANQLDKLLVKEAQGA